MQAPSTQPSKRGRPTIAHDNRRVKALTLCFDTGTDLCEALPQLDDVLTGITYLQSEGQASTRPLSKRLLLRVLQRSDTISTQCVSVALGRDYSAAAIARYTAVARAASKAIDRLLDQYPSWEATAFQLKERRGELDKPYLLELQGLGLM
jgi:hypothetical protein